jgi:site-specific recombinase XerD
MTRSIEFERIHPECRNVQVLKNHLINKNPKAKTVKDFWVEEISLLYKAKRNGNAKINQEVLTAIEKVKSLDVSFNEINFSFLQCLETELKAKGLKVNGIGLYMRTLRAIYNKAIKMEVADFNKYPFRLFKIKKEPTRNRTLTIDEVRSLFHLKVPENSTLYKSWLLAKLIFCLAGINFKDLVMLESHQVRNGRVFYTRYKTHKMYSIILHPEAIKIIDLFMQQNHENVFGLISPAVIANNARESLIIRQRIKVFNQHLNKLAVKARIPIKISSYYLRYSWANIARELGYPIELISAGLGHSYGQAVTLGYLNPFDVDKVDLMNIAVIDVVMKTRKVN